MEYSKTAKLRDAGRQREKNSSRIFGAERSRDLTFKLQAVVVVWFAVQGPKQAVNSLVQCLCATGPFFNCCSSFHIRCGNWWSCRHSPTTEVWMSEKYLYRFY